MYSHINQTDKFSLRKRLKSFSFAFNGFVNLIKNEHNARIHLVATVLAITLGILLNINFAEWIYIIIVIGLVLISELINTAIEKLSDIIEPEWNIKIRYIKDYSAGAVLIAAITALIVGGLIFIPKIIVLISSD